MEKTWLGLDEVPDEVRDEVSGQDEKRMKKASCALPAPHVKDIEVGNPDGF